MVHFFLLNDLHLSERTEETVFSILSYVASKARQQESCVAILGDMYDTVYKDGQVDARLQQRLYNFFADHFVDDQLYLLAGNHDMYNGYQESALSIFRSVAKVYDTPTVDENKILWLPYKDGGYTSDMFKKWKREGAFICFTHNDIKYLSTRKNNISREGMDPSVFKDMYHVFNGHYHYPNEYEQITCMGSQYAIHKTEIFDQKLLYKISINAEFENLSIGAEPIRFGRREFVYPVDYALDLYENYWSEYVKNKKDNPVPPPTYPTVQDTLIIECDLPVKTDIKDKFSTLGCPVQYRKSVVNSVSISESDEITLDSNIYDNVKFAVKDLYEFSPDLWTTSLKEIEDSILKEMKSFELKSKFLVVEKKPINLSFEKIYIQNFCNVKDYCSITYDKKTTMIVGPNGCGKTIRYPTALLYCVSGVIDDRFSEEKLVMSDVRNDKTSYNAKVTLHCKINDKTSIEISREFNGRKTILHYYVDDVEVKLPTIKLKQKSLCKLLFNIHIPDGTCPNQFTHKLMLQRVIWKQGGKQSDLLRLNKEAFKTLMMQHFNQGFYSAFIKHIKSQISEKKKLTKLLMEKVEIFKVIVDERKKISFEENTMLNSWIEHRRVTLQNCKDSLNDLLSLNVDKSNVDDYIKHKVDIKVLEQRIKDLVDSKEGLRWSPEVTINHYENAVEEGLTYSKQLDGIDEDIKFYVKCLETAKHIEKVLFSRSCDVLKNYSTVNFMPSKFKQMTDGTLFKYFSGGEYEEQSLKMFNDFRLFLSKYLNWECNLTIYDEPGTAMSTSSLQKFADGLKKDRCNIIITHKPLCCENEVKI